MGVPQGSPGAAGERGALGPAPFPGALSVRWGEGMRLRRSPVSASVPPLQRVLCKRPATRESHVHAQLTQASSLLVGLDRESKMTVAFALGEPEGTRLAGEAVFPVAGRAEDEGSSDFGPFLVLGNGRILTVLGFRK